MVRSAGCSRLRAEGFYCSLDIGQLRFFIENILICFSVAFLYIFVHQNPGIRNDRKGWIRKPMRIRVMLVYSTLSRLRTPEPVGRLLLMLM
jgi:hypothetical protein